uniref:uncharacterized protein LOC127066839 n=1 Tax=Vespula vulgaris TaxID=7454 RepID=UPI00223C3542|nr:uncharacterized protein LOC127066839 [Vespula vulgaris]
MDIVAFGFTFLTVFMSVGGAAGTCDHVRNEDMLEYSCVGGDPTDLYSIPTEVEKIRISKMKIPIITTDMFSRFGSNLWVLACSHCDISDIEPTAFQSLINLQQLSLDDNHLTTVKGAWFKGLDYLTYLDLNYNKITTIEDEVYENLPNVVDFRLSGNRFECLNRQAMENLKALKRIYLSENDEFKCPNAISKFLNDRGISFNKDPRWKDIDEVSDDDSMTVDRTETSIDYWPSTSDYRNKIYFPSVVVTTEDTRSPERTSISERIRYPLYAPVSVTTSDYNDKISQFSSVDSSSFVTTTNKPEVPRHYSTIVDPYRSYMTTTTTTQQPSRYPSTQPWPIVRKDETTIMDNEYHESFDYSDEVTGSSSLASSPTNRGALPPISDPKHILSTQPPEVYYTPNEILIEPNYPLPNPISDPQIEKNDMETIQMEDERYTMRPYVRPPIIPEIVQPAAPNDFLQVPYYQPTVTIRRPLSPPVNYEQQQQSTAVVETTTDKPFPECPSSSFSIKLTTTTLFFFIFLLNVIVQRF